MSKMNRKKRIEKPGSYSGSAGTFGTGLGGLLRDIVFTLSVMYFTMMSHMMVLEGHVSHK